ncbi:23S rRNA (uracil(1939)-C(5))-methyltransferase RlmD [Dissostichus eleginoides]|uniref:23S rRNA (Uracil(1939)-C(5))-methyltransferase RlmD n=1 Tax=Dissostichus eleginoides TaxID=100907 RepID=A0AAD9BQ14_DISEL|nr:23S rRNA (uracil(1939)-C(5))-methyltransferase RlmD [Dissostichus eleginoides]
MITEDMCEPMLKSLQHMVIPKLDRTLQEVAAPTWDGFASTGNTSWRHILMPLCGLGPDDARMWKCLDGLELSSEGRVWLQETWGVHSGVWRALLLKAQRALYKVVDMCADLSRDYAMVNSEHAFYIHPDIVFHSILRENLTAYIQSVMRNFLYTG